MIIEFDNVWARLASYTPEEWAWVDEYTSVEEEPNYWAGGWGAVELNPRYRMMHVVTGQFPAGFVAMLTRAAPRCGLAVELVDHRGPAPCPVEDFADLGWLRWYQHDAAWAATEAGRGVVKAPTGAGKTEILVALTRTLPCEWLLVTHRSDLVGQAARRFQARTGETAGSFEGGEWKRGSANLTVSTFQAIYHYQRRRTAGVRKLFEGVQGLLVDEVHAQPAVTFYRVSLAMKAARYRIGVSGTPLDRGDRDALRTLGACGPMLYKIGVPTLIAEGVLAPATIRMVECRQDGRTDCSWHDAYRQLIVASDRRNDVVEAMAVAARKPCLLFVDHIDHGRELLARLGRCGLRVDFAHGDHSAKVRLGMIRSLVEARLDVLICSVIFQEGIDIPELESVVMAGGRASVVGALQRMGRGMRVAQGKTGFELWDVWDRGQEWIAGHALARRRAYEKEGHVVRISQTADMGAVEGWKANGL